jgi:hypothetical protein
MQSRRRGSTMSRVLIDVVTIQEFKLMVEYDMNIIQDEADKLTFLASLYRRAGVLKSNYPEDLFREIDDA